MPQTQNWAAAVNAVTQASSRFGTALSHARLVQLQPHSVHLAFSPQASFHKNSVFGSGRHTVEKILSEFFKNPIQLVEDNAAQAYNLAKPSPAEQQEKFRKSQTRQLEAKVHAHPKIQSALSILGGHIESIQPIEAHTSTSSLGFEEEED
ncbi:MAG: DNA polymerase III subunit gamma/tau [Cystobacterineae bacterium]|nr:DNA polymerase III subunit gamma/tau [Cystobacterineae bacterium]